MIVTSYQPPFRFEMPNNSPWDRRRVVGLTLDGVAEFDAEHMLHAREMLSPFWLLGEAGGLAGTAVAPWRSAALSPLIALERGSVSVLIEPCILDERAAHCLLCLLLGLHEEIPLRRVSVATSEASSCPVQFAADVVDPYPKLWPHLPFQYEIEDSESETRILHAQFRTSLSNQQVDAVQRDLLLWGTAAEAGAFGIAPVEPRSCGCLPVNNVEHYEGEVIWAVEKCRFHPAALRSLVAVCATIHHRIANIAELTIE